MRTLELLPAWRPLSLLGSSRRCCTVCFSGAVPLPFPILSLAVEQSQSSTTSVMRIGRC